MTGSAAAPRSPRSAAFVTVIAAAAALAFGGFVALGVWQLERRAWKSDLIARVEERVRAPAVPAPGPDRWPTLSAASDEYRRVQATGRLLAESETLVQAATDYGAGFWVLTPLQLADDGRIVLINRGFVPPDRRDRATRRAGEPAAGTIVTVTGLLRLTEPGGGFLRRNDAAANRWTSRDVQAIAAARGLSRVAPYFIDAEAAPQAADDQPIGGLTVIVFHDNHLIYAITWFTLALMVAGAAWQVGREEYRLRQPRARSGPGRIDAGDDRATPR